MLETLVKQGVIFLVMGILMAVGVLAKLISYFTARRMVKAAKEIHKSEHRLMRLVKAKFEHASMVSDKVQNVEAFVDKYIYEYKVFGIRISGWQNFPKKILCIIVLLGAFTIFDSFRIAGFSDLFIESLQWTGIFVSFLLLFSFIAEENTKFDAAENYMVEYLENVCIHRYAKMHNVDRTAEETSEEKNEEKMPEETPQEEIEVQALEEQSQEQMKSEQEMRIRAILEEFLA